LTKILLNNIKISVMPTKKQPGAPIETPSPKKTPEVLPPFDPEDPVMPVEDPEIIPEEDPFETPPPFEIPPPGEGP
jgi:hypothetical protein